MHAVRRLALLACFATFAATGPASARLSLPPGHGGPVPGHGRPAPTPVETAPPTPLRCESTTTDGEPLVLEVTAPLHGATVSAYEPDCPATVVVDGLATVGMPLFDFYFVLDSSGSTGRCTGSDIDGDGIIGTSPPFGQTCSDPDDSVLGAEIAAVRGFVATLSPSRSRVAIIQFSAPDSSPFGGRQLIVQSLTSDFSLVEAALDEVAAFGSSGPTDYGGALYLLRDEYLANADPVGRRQYAYFLSDGVPTYPYGALSNEDPGDSEWALDAADALAALGIRVDTFGVGFLPSMTLDPVLPERCLVVRPSGAVELASTLECISLRTGGSFFASTDPADIVEEIRQGQPTDITSVVVVNETTGDAVEAMRSPDGPFTAEVPLEEGVVNILTVIALAGDGTTCSVTTDALVVCFASGCAPLTQGYWHRQCLGLGQIPSPGRMGAHPDWPLDLLARMLAELVDPQVAALGSPTDTTACEGLDAVPEFDPCQRAIKQYTALLCNMALGRLGPTCLLELPGYGEMSPEAARVIIADLIEQGLAGEPGACTLANDLADLINTGAAVR